jgi:1-acyl-sn-glycerol-3-phosphate acyltransferase
MNRVLKISSFLGLICLFIAESILDTVFRRSRDPNARENHKETANRIADYSNRALRILGIRTCLYDVPLEIRSGLIVANHLSYVDVLVLSRVAPLLFITSIEVKHSFGLGLITRLAGCLFVERRSRNHLKLESTTIEKVLHSRTPVVLFPEGTSSDGSGVLPFRPALFQSAIDANVPVHLFQIQYDDDAVPYHGDHSFLPHLFKLCSRKKIRASLRYLGRMSPEAGDRKTLANHAEIRIRSAHVSRISRSPSVQPDLGKVRPDPEPHHPQVGIV